MIVSREIVRAAYARALSLNSTPEDAARVVAQVYDIPVSAVLECIAEEQHA